MKEELHDKLFDSSALEDRIDADDGDEDDLGVACEVAEGMVIPFPLEKHPVLAQEMLSVFKAEVLLDASPGSGQTMLAVLLSNLQGVAIACNSVHQKFIMTSSSGTRRRLEALAALPQSTCQRRRRPCRPQRRLRRFLPFQLRGTIQRPALHQVHAEEPFRHFIKYTPR